MLHRLSRLLVGLKRTKPLKNVTNADLNQLPTSHELLMGASYIKQSSAGVYNILPLGLMVQSRVENIIRQRMAEAESYETSLGTLASVAIWEQSGRFDANDPTKIKEFFKVADSNYILAPTNEEEITSALKTEISSYKQLPLRLYQISKKFRNEKRPRGGLLRGREFLMKDLYSFDADKEGAHKTYEILRAAYKSVFSDIGLPFLVAEADSGSIGGSLSHEYHYKSEAGEDTLAVCPTCNYCANIERAVSSGPSIQVSESEPLAVMRFEPSPSSSSSPSSVSYVIYPSSRNLNSNHFKHRLGFDVESATATPVSLSSISSSQSATVLVEQRLDEASVVQLKSQFPNAQVIPVIEARHGDECPSCLEHQSSHSALGFVPAIEVAHTFYLGTKYSEPFRLTVTNKNGANNLVEMGCFGIGVSRLISAIAEVSKDSHGLVWPKRVSPFDCLIITTKEHVAQAIRDKLELQGLSCVWDDRSSQIGQLLSESTSLGFPLIIVAGNKFAKTGELEIESRQTREKSSCTLETLGQTAQSILDSCT